MQLFGVSRFKVYVAKVHASTDGAARRTPPSLSSFRIKPEVAAKLNAFANDPSNVQLLADNKGASHVSVALKQVPEKLYKKYEAEVPPELRVSRSKFLEFFKQPVFCLMRSKSCLCGPCTEHGTQVFAPCAAARHLLLATCCTPATMISLPRVFLSRKLKLVRAVLSEVGDGKNLVDTDFQQVQPS